MVELAEPAPGGRTPSCLAEARLGHHVAHLFSGASERAAAAAELLAAAMARGERALGLGDEASLEALAEAVAARGVDVATALARGALQLVPHREHFLPGGAFDPAQVMRAWQVRTEAAVAAGFTGLVVAADMDWALSGAPGTERLLEYEAAQGLVFGRHFAGMCQYDVARFPAPTLGGVLRTHALLFHEGEVLRNPATLAADVTPADLAEAGVARTLRALHGQREADQAVRQREARVRQVAEEALDLVYRYRLGPSPGLEYVGPSAAAMTGHTPEEHYADPRRWPGLVHPDDRARFEAMLRQPPAGPVLLRWLRQDGRVLWTEHQCALVRDEAGRPLAVQGLARDVTGRMEAEAALREAEHRASLGRLAAGVAQDLDDPVAWVGSNVHLVQEALAELEARGAASGLKELREALGDVVVGVDRVRAIVGGLQGEAGRAASGEVEAQAAPAVPAAQIAEDDP